MSTQPHSASLNKLRKAIEDYSSGQLKSDLFDAHLEESKAKVRHRALLLLDQRARSRAELRARLLAADFDVEVVEEVLDDLTRVGLIDDAAFAAEWVRQRHTRRGKSARALDRELRDKGVSQVYRTAALTEVTLDSERAVADELAAKKARCLKEIPVDRKERDKALRRIVGVLARRGFGEAVALHCAIEALDARIEELKACIEERED